MSNWAELAWPVGIRKPYFDSNAAVISSAFGFAVVPFLTISTEAPAGILPTVFLAVTFHNVADMVFQFKMDFEKGFLFAANPDVGIFVGKMLFAD